MLPDLGDTVCVLAMLLPPNVPKDIQESVVEVVVPYVSFEGVLCEGPLIVHAELAHEVVDIFKTLAKQKFPIEKIRPLHLYDWDDERSMQDNNTSAFNYRVILFTDRLSNHSYGRALDINPRLNPYLAYDKNIYPQGATYDASVPGTITKDDMVVSLFKSHGWSWGGDWETVKDYQHFEKL